MKITTYKTPYLNPRNYDPEPYNARLEVVLGFLILQCRRARWNHRNPNDQIVQGTRIKSDPDRELMCIFLSWVFLLFIGLLSLQLLHFLIFYVFIFIWSSEPDIGRSAVVYPCRRLLSNYVYSNVYIYIYIHIYIHMCISIYVCMYVCYKEFSVSLSILCCLLLFFTDAAWNSPQGMLGGSGSQAGQQANLPVCILFHESPKLRTVYDSALTVRVLS